MANGNENPGQESNQKSTGSRALSSCLLTWSTSSQHHQTMATEDMALDTSPPLSCTSSMEADSSASLACPNDKVTNFRKNWTRRNAWGSLSYAELITKAIESSPEKRLTLSQIYDWIVQNVDYFANKSDNSSSAGWKNSIRHNLSLHSRFVRLVNDGAGKSSWWVINPDAQPLKSSRRRAATLDCKSLRKKTEIGRRRPDNRQGLDEVDSTTNGSVFRSLKGCPANVFHEIGESVISRGSPHGYCENRGFRKLGPFTELLALDERGRIDEALQLMKDPLYGVEVADGLKQNHLEPLRCKGRGIEQSISNANSVSSDPNDSTAPYLNERHCIDKRRYIEDDQSGGSLGYCRGNGGFYDDGFDHQATATGNNYYPSSDFKRYFDKTSNCYETGIGYNCRVGNDSYSRCSPKHGTYISGYYGCHYNGRFPERYSAEKSPENTNDGLIDGQLDHGNGNNRRVGCGRGYGGKTDDGNMNTGDRLYSAVSVNDKEDYQTSMEMRFQTRGSYCSEEDGKRTYDGYSSLDLPSECISVGSHHDGSNSQTPVHPEFRRELATGKAAVDVGCNPIFLEACNKYDYRPMSPDHNRNEEHYYEGPKYTYLPPMTPIADLSSRSFSQLLADRTTFPNCRSASMVDDFFIPKAF